MGFNFHVAILSFHQEIPQDQYKLTDDEMIVCVAHFQKDLYNTFGTPFFVRLREVSNQFTVPFTHKKM